MFRLIQRQNHRPTFTFRFLPALRLLGKALEGIWTSGGAAIEDKRQRLLP